MAQERRRVDPELGGCIYGCMKPIGSYYLNMYVVHFEVHLRGSGLGHFTE